MQFLKVLIIISFGITLTACTTQQQIEGGAGYSRHSHAMPGGADDIIHSHGAPNDPSHSHTVSEVKRMMGQ